MSSPSCTSPHVSTAPSSSPSVLPRPPRLTRLSPTGNIRAPLPPASVVTFVGFAGVTAAAVGEACNKPESRVRRISRQLTAEQSVKNQRFVSSKNACHGHVCACTREDTCATYLRRVHTQTTGIPCIVLVFEWPVFFKCALVYKMSQNFKLCGALLLVLNSKLAVAQLATSTCT